MTVTEKVLKCNFPTAPLLAGQWYERSHLVPWGDNPSSRLDDDAGFKRLVEDMSTWGQANPLLLAETEIGLVILDGNRRFKAAGLLGWQHVWGLPIVKASYAEVPFYACRLNISRPWSSREVLDLASRMPDVFRYAPRDWQTKALLAYRALGPQEYEQFARTHGYGIRAIDLACRVCRYCGWVRGKQQVDEKKLGLVLRWFMLRGPGIIRGLEFALSSRAQGEDAISPDRLRHIIEAGEPLRLQW